MLNKIKETAAYIRKNFGEIPPTAIILGTGLGELAEHIDDKQELPYAEIPNFPLSTVEGHSGKLITGYLGSRKILAMQGRFHYYEGYTMQQVTFPVRVMQMLGVKTLFVSNAAGGMNPEFKVGDLMIITDHINTFPDNPLRGKNYEELGPRFPDMSATQPYRSASGSIRRDARTLVRNPGRIPLLPHNRRRCRRYVDRTRSHRCSPRRHGSFCHVGHYRPRRIRRHHKMLSRRGTKSRRRSTTPYDTHHAPAYRRNSINTTSITKSEWKTNNGPTSPP